MEVASMVVVECIDVGVEKISKAALAQGMSKYVSVVYSNALGTLILIPQFVFNRNKRLPITRRLLFNVFVLSLIWSAEQIISLAAVKSNSPTRSSAMANLIPIFTFLLAVITGMETPDLSKSSCQAKYFGAILSVTGAFVVTLCKGPAVLTPSLASDCHHVRLLSQKPEGILDSFLLVIVSILHAARKVLLGLTVRQYQEEESTIIFPEEESAIICPEKGITIIFLFTSFIAIESVAFSLILERNPNAWRLKKPAIEITTTLFKAGCRRLFRNSVHTRCLGKKKMGPVYVSMFKPLGVAIEVFFTVAFLVDTLYLGSVIGSIMIAIGFCIFLWGQPKKKKKKNKDLMNDEASSSESSIECPLLS